MSGHQASPFVNLGSDRFWPKSVSGLRIFTLSIMNAHLTLKITLGLRLLLLTSGSDLVWPSSEDSIFSDTGLSLSQTSFIDSLKSSEHQESLFEGLDDGIVLPFSDTDALVGSPFSTNDAFDTALELTDCSSPEILHTIGQSRVRRWDGSGYCKDPSREPHTNSEDVFKERMDLLRSDPNILDKLTETMRNRAANTLCVFYTFSILPWGVCSSGWPADEILLGKTMTIPGRGVFDLYRLEYYKLGKL